jgi:purine-binding chemotaxis protein CheW
MSDNRPAAPSRAARLREAFDATFAAPSAGRVGPGRRLLLVGVGGASCAVPLEHCAAVHAAATITPLPAALPAFRGVAAVGGAILPVYDLAALLGLDARFPHRAWLLVAAGRHPVAFVVDGVEGYAEIEAEAGSAPTEVAVVTVDGVPRRVVALGSIVAAIDAAVQTLNPARSER